MDLRQISENFFKHEAKENQRTRLTKRLLRESLLELLKEKPVDCITVKELCENAEINRSTFYAYYTDVPALYEEMGNELADALLEHIKTMTSGPDTELMLTYIRDNCEMFRLLVYCDHYTDFNQAIITRIFQDLFKMPLKENLNCLPGEQEYVLQFMFMGGTGIIHHWVQNNCDLPPKQVAHLIDTLISRVSIVQ